MPETENKGLGAWVASAMNNVSKTCGITLENDFFSTFQQFS